MKRLFLVRHAKSYWECDWLTDLERPLNERGKRDAPRMGSILSTNYERPQLLISSPASRAYTTARIIAVGMGYPPEDIRLVEGIYEAMSRDLLRIIGETDDDVSSLMAFGHNPTMTTVANRLTNAGIENVPTTGIVIVDFEVDSWRKAVETIGKLVAFEYPKKYRQG